MHFYDIVFLICQYQAREFHRQAWFFLQRNLDFLIVCGKLCFSASQANKYISGTKVVHWMRQSIAEGEEGFPLREVTWSHICTMSVVCTWPVGHWQCRTDWRKDWWIQLKTEVNICIFCNNPLHCCSSLTDWWSPEGAGLSWISTIPSWLWS